jgi:hypothetical protein
MLNNHRLSRFLLRGQHKVWMQWRLFSLVHNIVKLASCDPKQKERKPG